MRQFKVNDTIKISMQRKDWWGIGKIDCVMYSISKPNTLALFLIGPGMNDWFYYDNSKNLVKTKNCKTKYKIEVLESEYNFSNEIESNRNRKNDLEKQRQLNNDMALQKRFIKK